MDRNNLETVELGNGIKMHLYHMPEKHSIKVQSLIFTGSKYDPVGLEGLHHALEHLPFRGTKNFPSNSEVHSPVEILDGKMNASVSNDDTVYHCTVPTEKGKLAVDIVADLTFAPILTESSLAKELPVYIEEYRDGEYDEAKVLSSEYRRLVYPNTRLHHQPVGLPTSIKKFKLDDIIAIRNRYYTGNNTRILVAGNITAEVKQHAEKVFGQLDIELGDNYKSHEEHNTFTGEIHELNHPAFKRPKVSIYFFQGAMSIEERLASLMFSSMLSAGSSSPMHEELRVKNGLCYGARTDASTEMGPFIAMSIKIKCQKENISKVIQKTWEVVDRTKNDQQRFEFCKERQLWSLKAHEDTINHTIGWMVGAEETWGEWYDIPYLAQALNEMNFDHCMSLVQPWIVQNKSLTIIATE